MRGFQRIAPHADESREVHFASCPFMLWMTPHFKGIVRPKLTAISTEALMTFHFIFTEYFFLPNYPSRESRSC